MSTAQRDTLRTLITMGRRPSQYMDGRVLPALARKGWINYDVANSGTEYVFITDAGAAALANNTNPIVVS